MRSYRPQISCQAHCVNWRGTKQFPASSRVFIYESRIVHVCHNWLLVVQFIIDPQPILGIGIIPAIWLSLLLLSSWLLWLWLGCLQSSWVLWSCLAFSKSSFLSLFSKSCQIRSLSSSSYLILVTCNKCSKYVEGFFSVNRFELYARKIAKILNMYAPFQMIL